ncbi:AAA family ATPase [Telmatospirillum siberiense]|uniref:Chromosome partition protein Smc n=1 Tax=Telmatospirillum siberiense TaxID=382514 RepID=A0A2N3PTP5_9PROT|nr:AAA family ATPase [Telmatospirillum siberiense]PKU23763.1 chromosome partitioning protein ParA [Telmatospirillum siberiense]
MIHFQRLRLSGFKSFVDPIDVVIAPGMTGVVGPNGCGKSNLVEALRWVMGETSAKQMRGGEMDDVIFGGSANRPPRNLAEVTLVLDNRARTAPAQFNDFEELEVTRRIDRGQGSLYKVNGKEARARDVQILFADAATGARSTAIVSQGRIGAIINAKPSDRRSLLEEAAGIGGLHSRRHEAELRLKAAEANLERLVDVLSTHDTQLQALKRQARQAARYRNLSQQIRDIEARLLAALWAAAMQDLDAARDGGDDVERQVATLTGLAAEAATRQTEAAVGLPALRQAEAERAAKLQRLSLAREQLDAEEGRLGAAKRDLELRLEQISTDLHREAARAADAEQALGRLADEKDALVSACADEADQQTHATGEVETITAEASAIEAELAKVMEEVAAADADRAAALRAVGEAEARRERLESRAREMIDLRQAAEAEAIDQAELTSAEMDLEEALEYLETCRAQAEGLEQRRHDAQAARERARDILQEATSSRARLQAEADALKELVAQAAGGDHAPVLDDVNAVSGYEIALGAALGEDLTAPLEAEAPFSWRSLPPLATPPALPPGIPPLSHYVTAPPALARRLGQIGVVNDPGQGASLQADLAPGQRLVSPDGAFWRWDGFTAQAGAPSPTAVRLRQRNRLRELTLQIDDAELGVAEAENRTAEAAAAVEREAAAERQVREDMKRAEGDAAKLREAHAKLAQKAAAAQSRLTALSERETAIEADLAEARAAEETARTVVAGFTGNNEGRDRVASLRADLAEKRTHLVEARSFLDRLLREAGDRRRRLDAITSEETSWGERSVTAGRHREELEERRETVFSELEHLAALPMEIAEKRQTLLDDMATAEEERRQAAAALVDGEQLLAAAERMLKEAEQALAAAREERIRRQAAIAAAAQQAKAVAERIAEKLDLTPTQLAEQIDGTEPVDVAEAEAKLDRLTRERENMGPVNLRAEEEAAELEQRLAELTAERDDLVAAIAKLRQGISDINRQGRERLLASFEAVDQHFRGMFVRLFGGGRAHLTLTESNDPLQAGLEIMASPPGKRLQVLSLLSGGEQALTALALLFAVFMTNPAPICVLDEVDAPLDDANVDRFCSMVGEIAQTTKTRFMVVTHHRMTMARMDRLFGVTMAERGVSTVVSVDLHTAEALREPN